MSRVYINDPSAAVRLKNGRMEIEVKDGVLRSIPLEMMEGFAVTVFGVDRVETAEDVIII